MTQYEIENLKEGKAVTVRDFEDYTKKPGDDWLVFGIRDYLADLLRTAKGLRVMAGRTMPSSSQTPVDIAISGKFQHIEQNLRVFIQITDVQSTKLIKQIEVVVPYPENKEFFTKLADAARQIIELTGAKIDSGAFDRVAWATASTRAYESYAKGRQTLESYQLSKAELSSTWFEEAKRLDYRSPLGYAGMIDLYTFLGFYHKQLSEPYNTYFQKAEEELARMTSLGISSKRESKKQTIENRLLAGHVDFSRGIKAYNSGNFEAAIGGLGEAVKKVPEDARAWHFLSLALKNSGNVSAAEEALQKARTLNPCLLLN